MDDNEIAGRLQEIREQIRDELAAATPPRILDETPDLEALELAAATPPSEPGTPQLITTEHLRAANELAVISAPLEISSGVPVIGPLLDLLRRLARPFVQPFIDPYVARQERFNAEVIRHLNELGGRLEQRIAGVQDALLSRAGDPHLLEARLDAALASYDDALRSRHTVLFDALEEELWALHGQVGDAAKRWRRELDEKAGDSAAAMHAFDVRFVERAQAVDRRFDEKDRAFDEAIRTRGGGPGYAELMATRAQLARVLELVPGGDDDPGAGSQSDEGGAPAALDGALWKKLRAWMGDQDYRAFQEQFRGDEGEITARMAAHVDRFAGAPGPIADLGCGRGEFLELLEAAGHEAIGVEINGADVDSCRERELQAVEADLFDWLNEQPEESLGGIFLAQVIEHLVPSDWTRLVDLAATRLRPGGRLLVETINPESVYALGRAYVLDPTHVRPVHPELLAFLAARAGFGTVEIHYQAEVPENLRVDALDEAPYSGEVDLLPLVQGVNERLHRINRLCCAPQEYALVAIRPPAD